MDSSDAGIAGTTKSADDRQCDATVAAGAAGGTAYGINYWQRNATGAGASESGKVIMRSFRARQN